jgi:hypothetical protein
MENTLLYFYSTIPQVLAAIIALVFVFVIFKLQDFDKIINIQCTNFARTLGNNVTSITNWQDLGTGGTFMSNYLAKYFKGISELMDKICSERENDNKHAVEQLRKISTKTKAIEKQRKAMIISAQLLCAFGFLIIIGSISTIHFVKTIATDCNTINILFVIFITLTAVSLIWVYMILSVSLNK